MKKIISASNSDYLNGKLDTFKENNTVTHVEYNAKSSLLDTEYYATVTYSPNFTTDSDKLGWTIFIIIIIGMSTTAVLATFKGECISCYFRFFWLYPILSIVYTLKGYIISQLEFKPTFSKLAKMLGLSLFLKLGYFLGSDSTIQNGDEK